MFQISDCTVSGVAGGEARASEHRLWGACQHILFSQLKRVFKHKFKSKTCLKCVFYEKSSKISETSEDPPVP